MAVLEGLLFGMLLQLSVGPVCLAVWQRSIKNGMKDALKMIGGVALVDAAYMLAAIGGLSLLLQIPWVKSAVLVGGAAILIWFGFSSLRSKPVQTVDVEKGDEKREEKQQGSFFYGVALTLTNPLTILFWSGVFGSLMASQTLADSMSLAGFVTGCLLATLLFLTGIAALGQWMSRFLNPVWIQRLDKAVGVVLIGFAIILLQKGILQ
jgi:threonine/homoserine/homoserine lactone efflux protein